MKRYISASSESVKDISDYMHDYVKHLIVDVENTIAEYVKDNVTEFEEIEDSYNKLDTCYEIALDVYEVFIQDIKLAQGTPGEDFNIAYEIILEAPKDIIVKALSASIYVKFKTQKDGSYKL